MKSQPLYFDHLVAEKHPSFTYSLVSVIYRYGNVVEQVHFNCALFSNNSVCKVFDDATIKQATCEEVLLDVAKQRHSHVCFYVLDKVIDIQTFATNLVTHFDTFIYKILSLGIVSSNSLRKVSVIFQLTFIILKSDRCHQGYFFFFQIFCKYHNLDEIKWKLLIYDYTQQQNNDKDCGVFCCINAYCFIFNKDILLKDSETLAARMWIAKKCLEVQVTESFRKSDGLDENKLEHVLEELNNYQIDQYAVSAYSSRGTDHERWAAMRIAKLNLCQLDAPIKFDLKMEDFQNNLDSENNGDNDCNQSSSPGMKFFENVTYFCYHFPR